MVPDGGGCGGHARRSHGSSRRVQGCFDCADRSKDHGRVEMTHVGETETLDASDTETDDESSSFFAHAAECSGVG